MIAYVSGTLIDKKPTEALIDVHGVGYAILIPTSTYEQLPEEGKPARLFTHFHVREDAHQLYGFATVAERSLFDEMLAVSGIGPRLALAALSAMRPAELRDYLIEGNVGMITRIPGVGRKTAERMVVELKDRLVKLDLPGAGVLSDPSDTRAEARSDALAALEALGLNRATAERSLRLVLRNNPGIQSAQELIRLALREK
ncbi:MAG: Holliday junction branch migration protein RuvA [Rhodothermales bacterium]|nr:Holliday junction branch migration protein RuvA [Rhodothermales bacterium]